MLCYVLSDEFDDDVARANYDYYEPITSHGSSLRPGIHAAVAARLGDVDAAVEDFKMAAAIDLADNMGNAARGLHMATMGGLWQAAVMGFAGLQRRDEALLIDPHLPPHWKRVSVPLCFRGARARSTCVAAARRRGGYNGRAGRAHGAPRRRGRTCCSRQAPPAASRRRTLGGGLAMTLLIAVATRRPTASWSPAPATREGRRLGRSAPCTCTSAGEAGARHADGPGPRDRRAGRATRADGWLTRRAGRRRRGRLGLRSATRGRLGPRGRGAARGAHGAAAAGEARHAPAHHPAAPGRPARGQSVGVRGHASRRRRPVRARPRDRDAARGHRRPRPASAAASRRRASSTRSTTSGPPGRTSSACASRSAPEGGRHRVACASASPRASIVKEAPRGDAELIVLSWRAASPRATGPS